ncbi:hypothetical protein GCM10010178_48280 [Lentzea flava]|uniref:DUF222 domain-containing protein n=1 Tax=Lentzea flava TaxID=103732 RepID=A0ABQ2USQ2_9PSEU|nr:protein of unknown function (DUF885) [Lentzea flava]GGU49790.1 hypothetical protein GCM10010178_48280 [Lentzea flava]
MRDLADQLSDLILDHHTLRPNLMGLRDDGELQDHSEEADEAYLRRYRAIAGEAERRTAETEDDRITRDLVLHLTRAECDTIESRAIEYGVSGYLQAAVPELLYFLGHLKSHHAVPRFIATVAERHRAGVAAGRTPVRHLVEQAIALVDQYDDPAVRHYRDVLVNDVLPHGRDEEHAGLCWLPGGEALYRNAIRTHTTLDLDPHELHATGLRLIDDIKREFDVRRRRGDDRGRREGRSPS